MWGGFSNGVVGLRNGHETALEFVYGAGLVALCTIFRPRPAGMGLLAKFCQQTGQNYFISCPLVFVVFVAGLRACVQQSTHYAASLAARGLSFHGVDGVDGPQPTGEPNVGAAGCYIAAVKQKHIV